MAETKAVSEKKSIVVDGVAYKPEDAVPPEVAGKILASEKHPVSEKTLAQWRWKRVGPKFFRLIGGGKIYYIVRELAAYKDMMVADNHDALEKQGM